MREKVDLLISQASELVTADCPGGSDAEEKLGIIRDGAVALSEGKVVAVGPSAQVRERVSLRAGGREVSAWGRVVLPGLVDAHTHPVFAGSREDEFELRIQGLSYQEIAARGGGIRKTMEAVRRASAAELERLGRRHLDRMLRYGTTTAEAKSGYALSTEGEIKLLETIRRLDESHPIRLVPTFLGAHEFPPEYHLDHEGYVDLLVEEMIPQVAERGLATFCDVFCEEGVFSVPQSRRVLAAARVRGMRPKIHAEEFVCTGGAELAAELGAISADHLGAISGEGMVALKKAGVVPVLLPGTTFYLGLEGGAPARQMLDLGLPVALATDLNPGSSPTESLQIIATLAAVRLKMTAAEIVLGMTRNAASAVGLEGEAGSLASGRRGDVVMMDFPTYRYLPYHYGVNHAALVVCGGQVVVEDGRRVN